MGSTEKTSGPAASVSHLASFLLLLKTTQIMSSQALKATVQQSVRMASQVVEQQSRHGGGFVWRAGVGYQYQGGQQQAQEQQWGRVQQGKEREGKFTQGLGWEHLYTSCGPSS